MNKQDSYRPLLNQHEKIIEKYKLFLNTTAPYVQPKNNTTTITTTSPVLLNRTTNINRDYGNEQNKIQQIDQILNNLTAKKLIQEPLREQSNKSYLNIEALKEKYLNEISNPKYKLKNKQQQIIVNSNEEIQRIKAKYFIKENNKTPLDDGSSSSGKKYEKFLEDELVKYQQRKINQIQPYVNQDKETPETYEDNNIQKPLKTDYNEEDNSLLISKMSIFESQCDNQYQMTTNSKVNSTIRNDDTRNNISLTYSKNSNDNNNDNANDHQDEVNYEEVNSIVQRMERLKQIEEEEDNNRQKKPDTKSPIKDHNQNENQIQKEAQQIISNALNSIPNPSLNSNDEMIIKDNKKINCITKPRTQKPKAKLISFEEFLDNEN